MISIKYSGGLGNMMFKYGAAHILSKKHKMLISSKLPGYPCNPNLDIIPRQFSTEILVKNQNFMEISEKQNIESNLILDAYFQTSEIVNKYKDDLKSCFELDQEPINGTIIHYRMGDLSNLYDRGAITKLNYFEKCINYLNDKNNIYITTDSPNDETIKYLVIKYNMTLINIKRDDTIKFASRFTNKILSMGTFSWWIGLLGKQDSNVYCPIPTEYVDWMGDIYVLDNWNYVSYK